MDLITPWNTVIGIHKNGDKNKKTNGGKFIGEIFQEKEENKININNDNNYIIAEINIQDENINKDVRIINSYEEYMRNNSSTPKLSDNFLNEEEIKKCEIRIENELIPFNYFHQFKSVGKYIITYTFNNCLTKTDYMFFGCKFIIRMDFSNFNTQNITNMSKMFSECSSLTNINLSNFNNHNIIKIDDIFLGCSYLKKQNVIINDTKILEEFNKKIDNKNNVDLFNDWKEGTGNKMTIIYNIGFIEDKIELFGKEFVENNKNNCFIIVDGKQQALCTHLILDDKMKKQNTLEIKLVEVKEITDMSHMFENGINLSFSTVLYESLPFISRLKKINSLISLPDISKWDSKNITDMNCMFSNCILLKSLPDISKWDTSNVSNMSYLFYYCESLESLPDISKWNTINVSNMSYMFNSCKSLKSLPDISKWKTSIVTDMSCMFNFCQSLKNLPDISKWDIKKVTDISFMFAHCTSLLFLPDISKWNTKNVSDMASMFSHCKALNSLPDISKWNTSNVFNMSSTFYSCKSLKSFPDISKWKTKNVTDMSNMFGYCESLESLPDISKWEFNPNTKKNSIFKGCNEKLIPENYRESNCSVY